MNTLNTMIPMGRMLDAAFRGQLEDWQHEERVFATTPRADILESTQEYRIVMDLPGVKTEDLDISLENQNLTVTAERKQDVPEEFQSRRRERAGHVTFSRSFDLSNAIEADKISAKLEHGVLWLTLPKSEKSLPRKIEVK